MSGGFFRGTSADQDTRFSNKMKKLLKSQKFAPELDVAIDTSKVQIDVIKPWIATRATELLGFEDEVLINFIYGLLDVKIVDGKHVQIQLTGFMEKNTGKFMKELWSLLISAQSNLSGIPQQFLDLKAEETRLKKVESERIAAELQRKRDQDKLAEEERQREKDAAAEAARIARGAKSSAETDRDAKQSDDRRTGRGNGISKRSVSRDRSPPGRSYRRHQRSRYSSGSSISRSPVKSSPKRRPSPSVSRSPRRRKRSLTPDQPARVQRVVHSPVRRSYSRSPIRKRKSPPTHRSPVRRRYPSRSPPSRRSSSYSLSPVPRSRPRSPYRRNGVDARRQFRSPGRVDHLGRKDRRATLSPDYRKSESPSKPPVSNRQTSNVAERRTTYDMNERRGGTERDGRGPIGERRTFGDRDQRKIGPLNREARGVAGEKRLYSDIEERKTGPDRAAREKKDKWAHSDFNDEDGEPQRVGREVVGEKRLFTDIAERRTGLERSGRDKREKWSQKDLNEGDRETARAGTGMPGEKRPHSEIERSTGVDRAERVVEDRYYVDNGKRADDRSGKDTGSERRDLDMRKAASVKEDRFFSEKRDRLTGRERSPVLDRQQSFKDTRGVRRNDELSQSPAEERRKEDQVRLSIEPDNEDSDTVRESLRKKSRIQETEEVATVREDDEDSLSSRGSEERRKEEKRRRKEEKRRRKEERHKRKREEKQKRKEEKRAMKSGSKIANGEDKRDSPEGMDQSEEEHSEYDHKRLEDALRHKALESLRAKKAISH